MAGRFLSSRMNRLKDSLFGSTEPTRNALKPWILATLPGVAMIASIGIAHLCPSSSIWGYALQAVLFSAPPWIGLLWPAWCLVVFLRTRQKLILVMLPAGAMFVGRPMLSVPKFEPAGLKVVSANVNAFFEDRDVLEKELAALEADLLFVIEQRAFEVDGMRRVEDNFDTDLPRISHAVAVFCRDGLSCPSHITPQIGSPTMAMPFALVRPLPEVCFVNIHAPPPVPRDPTGMTPYVDWLIDRIENGRLQRDWGPCLPGDAVVVLGDLNAVPRSRPYQRLRAAGLEDPLAGSGLWGLSWPSGGGWPDFPLFRLDHVLLGGVPLSGLHHVELTGADHLALVGWYAGSDD